MSKQPAVYIYQTRETALNLPATLKIPKLRFS